MRRFIEHADRNRSEQNRAREGHEIADLPRAEAVALRTRVTLRERIRVGSSAKHRDVTRHVQPVGEQRDRAEHEPGHDFGAHHQRGQRHDEPRAARVPLMVRAEIAMVVTKGRERIVEARSQQNSDGRWPGENGV